MRTYRELSRIITFKERFDYLKLNGEVGKDTFGFDRWVNQKFYRSIEWLNVRNYVIARDLACDLGIEDREIRGRIIIHHMNPISLDDIRHGSNFLLNPDYLICTAHNTHNAIHYGDEKLLTMDYKPRRRNDTIPWRH